MEDITKEEELRDEAWLEQEPIEEKEEKIEIPALSGDKFIAELEKLGIKND